MASKSIGLVYDAKDPSASAGALAALTGAQFFPRNKTNIMHNKFLVAGDRLLAGQAPAPRRLTCGSANYTTQGLTSQANLIHTFESPELAQLYFERFLLIKSNPTRGTTAQHAGWSSTVSVGDAGLRVFFSPERGNPGDDSASIETIVANVHAARSSSFSASSHRPTRSCGRLVSRLATRAR